jgi:hypothetical protein
LSAYDQNGAIVPVANVVAGVNIYVYQSGTADELVEFTATGNPVLQTGNTWWIIPVTYVRTGSAGFAPNNNTQMQVQASGTSGGVPSSRLINTTAPLTGGGDLSADRTLAITSFAGSAPGAVPTSVGGTTNFLRADGTWAAPAGGGTVNKYAAALTGNVAYATGEVVTHNLGSRDVHVAVINGASPYQRVEVDWEATSTTQVTLRYNPALGAGFRCVVMV